jgi:hypothetical protein
VKLGIPDGPWQSGIKVQNLANKSGNVSIEFINRAGDTVGERAEAVIQAGASREFYLAQLTLPDGAYSARVHSDVPVAVVALHMEYDDGIGDSYGAAGTAAKVHLPLIYRGSNDWNSTVYVQNARDRATTVGFRIYSAKGVEKKFISRNLPARGRVTLDLTTTNFSALGTSFTGYGVITTTPNTSVAVTVMQAKLTDSRHFLTSLPGMTQADAGNRVALSALYRKWHGWRSSIRLLNYSDTEPVTAKIFYKSHKNSTTERQWQSNGLSIPAGGFLDVGLMTAKLKSGKQLPDGFHGSAVVSATGRLVVVVTHTYPKQDVGVSQSGTPLRKVSGRLAFPSLYNKLGEGLWKSQIRIQNTHRTQSVRVKFTFRVDDGLSLQGTWKKSNVLIPPRRAYTFFLGTMKLDGGSTLPDGFRGSAIVQVTTGPEALVGSAMNTNWLRRVATMYGAVAY